jgi:ribosomal protein L19
MYCKNSNHKRNKIKNIKMKRIKKPHETKIKKLNHGKIVRKRTKIKEEKK